MTVNNLDEVRSLTMPPSVVLEVLGLVGDLLKFDVGLPLEAHETRCCFLFLNVSPDDFLPRMHLQQKYQWKKVKIYVFI